MGGLNIITRRAFLSRSTAVALATLTDVPLLVKRALAESGTIGLNGKKLLFIFLRGANDALNSVIPVRDPAYVASRPTLQIPSDPEANYEATGPCVDIQNSVSSEATYRYPYAIPAGNGFAALHPSLRFLAQPYNAGDLALVHRVGYPRQNRSHFESQMNWENGMPNTNASEGVFYRALAEADLLRNHPLAGVSIQSALPLLLQGKQGALLNMPDPSEFQLIGTPGNVDGKQRLLDSLQVANNIPFARKENRELLRLHYRNMVEAQRILADLRFGEEANTFVDDQTLDAESEPYYLFPTNIFKNGAARFYDHSPEKTVVNGGAYAFFQSLKAAAIILNQTDAVIAGTELEGWDTHVNQGGVAGTHPQLLRYVGWAIYALRKFFKIYGKGGPQAMAGAQAAWKDVVVVVMTEFGRTTVENSSLGTDHAEGGLMFLCGGNIRGFNVDSNNSGIYGCSPADAYNGHDVPWQVGPQGSMFRVNGRYLRRIADFRSVLGELIRSHLGASADQLRRIIPGYANPAEMLETGGVSIDNTRIVGELNLVGSEPQNEGAENGA